MRFSGVERIRNCCGNSKSHLIFYDGADTADLPVLVCDICIENSIFQKFVTAKFPLTPETNLDQLLQNYLKN